ASESSRGAASCALMSGIDELAVHATIVPVPSDEGRWTTIAELTVGQYQYRLMRSNAKRLTRRETDVIEGVMRGSSNKVIAYDLGIAHSTVRVLLFRAMVKLGVRKRADLVTLLQSMANEACTPVNDGSALPHHAGSTIDRVLLHPMKSAAREQNSTRV